MTELDPIAAVVAELPPLPPELRARLSALLGAELGDPDLRQQVAAAVQVAAEGPQP